MKKQLSLLLILPLLITILLSCGKEDEIEPQANIVGTWTLKSSTGSMTFDGSSHDINDPDFEITFASEITFNENGTATSDGESANYTISGNTITFEDPNFKTTYTYTATENVLILKTDQNGYEEILEFLGELLDSTITDFDMTSTFNKK